MEANSRKSGFAESGLLPPSYPTGIRAGVGSQNGNKVKFSDWKKTNDKKSNVSALAKLVRDDSEDSENNEKGKLNPLSDLSNENKRFFTHDNTV